MTIIFEMGNEFWIEVVNLPIITVMDAAGRYNSAGVNLERSGRFIGGAILNTGGTSNDNTQAIGIQDLRASPNNVLTVGLLINAVLWRVYKEIGTAGDTTVNGIAILFMRGSGR